MNKSLFETLKDDYQLTMSDDDCKRLADVLTMYNVNPVSCKIDLQSSFENFVNNIHLMKNIKFTRMHSLFEIEDVIYQLHPLNFGCYEKFETAYPSHFTHTINHEVPSEYQDMDENMVVIRTQNYDSRAPLPYIESYTLMIYNKKLDVRAGIRFEDI